MKIKERKVRNNMRLSIMASKLKEINMREISKDELQDILENHKHWLNCDCDGWESMRTDLKWTNLQGTNLKWTNLQGANLQDANLQDADLDFSCLPLWCGSLSANFDSRQLKQIAYHLVKAGLQSKNATKEDKTELRKLIEYANKFHRLHECGEIKEEAEMGQA